MNVAARLKQGYRPEIDGLRSIAVLSVVFFHVDWLLFSGGFVGVDIFFVISGFLITANIRKELAAGSFSFVSFYLRRFRRLYPALLATTFASCIAALFLFSPEHLSRFGWEVLSALFSVSNIFFWTESGYFDLDGTFKPLLHTWSLSVEEQFYLVWPASLMLLGLLRSSKFQITVLIILGGISLLLAELVVRQENASLAFYMLPFRVCEFVLGAVLAFLPDNRQRVLEPIRAVVTLLGLTILLYPIFAYSNVTPFPGMAALLPCLGTTLVIWASSNRVSELVLGNAAARWLGKISYSVYLVHWPLVVFWAYMTPGDFSYADQAIICLGSVLLGYASWRWIEEVFRYPTPEKRPALLGTGRFVAAFLSLSLTCGIVFYLSNGAVAQKDVVLSSEQVQKGKSKRFDLVRRGCSIRSLGDNERCNLDAPQQTLIFGNSHEPDGYNIWQRAFGDADHNIISFGTVNHCGAFLQDLDAELPDKRYCRERIRTLLDKSFIRSLDTLVVSSNNPFAPNKDKFFDVVVQLKKNNPALHVVVLGGYFNLGKDCSYYIDQYGSSRACLNSEFVTVGPQAEKAALQRWLDTKTAEFLKPEYISKFDLLCRQGHCLAEAGGVPFTYDRHHLSLEFALEIGDRLSEAYAGGMPGAER